MLLAGRRVLHPGPGVLLRRLPAQPHLRADRPELPGQWRGVRRRGSVLLGVLRRGRVGRVLRADGRGVRRRRRLLRSPGRDRRRVRVRQRREPLLRPGGLRLRPRGGARLASDRSPLALALCAEPYVGWLRGTGSDFELPRPAQTHLWLAGGLTLDADGEISGPLRWFARGGGLLVAKRRFTVRVDRVPETLFATSLATLLASAGLRFHFE